MCVSANIAEPHSPSADPRIVVFIASTGAMPRECQKPAPDLSRPAASNRFPNTPIGTANANRGGILSRGLAPQAQSPPAVH
jgi:hypothetical protein